MGYSWAWYRDQAVKILRQLKEEGVINGFTLSRPGGGVNFHAWGRYGDVYFSGTWEEIYWIARAIYMGYRAGKAKGSTKKSTNRSKKRKR